MAQIKEVKNDVSDHIIRISHGEAGFQLLHYKKLVGKVWVLTVPGNGSWKRVPTPIALELVQQMKLPWEIRG